MGNFVKFSQTSSKVNIFATRVVLRHFISFSSKTKSFGAYLFYLFMSIYNQIVQRLHTNNKQNSKQTSLHSSYFNLQLNIFHSTKYKSNISICHHYRQYDIVMLISSEPNHESYRNGTTIKQSTEILFLKKCRNNGKQLTENNANDAKPQRISARR